MTSSKPSPLTSPAPVAPTQPYPPSCCPLVTIQSAFAGVPFGPSPAGPPYHMKSAPSWGWTPSHPLAPTMISSYPSPLTSPAPATILPRWHPAFTSHVADQLALSGVPFGPRPEALPYHTKAAPPSRTVVL